MRHIRLSNQATSFLAARPPQRLVANHAISHLHADGRRGRDSNLLRSRGLLREMHNHNQEVHIGDRSVWGGTQPFSLHVADRLQHTLILGQTGTGKTTLLKNLMIQDLRAGRGAALIDPHGDIAHDILDFIPRHRIRDVIYFNPADSEFPVALNLLAGSTDADRHLLTSGIVAAFKSVWRDSWGVRMQYILTATIAALAECFESTANTTLLGIQRMLVDARYREWVMTHVTDPAVRTFWLFEFENFDKRFAVEAVAPIQNKIGALLLSPAIRHSLGQVRKAFDFRWIMDTQRIFVANLAKGRIGEETSNLLGALLVSQFEHAALSRADVPEHERRNFFLYVDEFHNFATDSFSSMLSESRKFGLGLALGTQYTARLREDIRDAVFGNCGTLFSFRVGADDARLLQSAFGNSHVADQFTALANYEILVKLLNDGQLREPFQARTAPPLGQPANLRQAIIERSRERYAMSRSVVESKIKRWMER